MHTNSLPAPSASIVPAASHQPSQPHEATPSSKDLTSAVSPPSTTDGVEDALADRVNSVQLDPTQGILALAVETRLNIYRHVIFVDRYKFCPHARLPLLVSSPGIGQPYYHQGPPVPCLFGRNICGRGRAHHECLVAFLRTKTHLPSVNQVDLSLLRVSRRIRAEALDLFYSETIFYFEQHLTLASITFPNKRFNPLTLPTHLLGIPPYHLHLVKKIGFAVTDESALDHGFLLWRHLCEWINKNLPNLRHTYVFLFSPVTSSPSRVLDTEKQFLRPSDRFLVKTIDFLDTIPGHKTIEFRGSNKNKRIIGNILAAHFDKGRKKKDRSIDVVGGCSCQCWMHNPSLAQRNWTAHHWTGPDTLWPWLRDWNDEKARHARQGSFPPKWCSTHKGLLTGCLMCWRLTECIHDQQNKNNKSLKPGRISLDGVSDGYGANWGF